MRLNLFAIYKGDRIIDVIVCSHNTLNTKLKYKFIDVFVGPNCVQNACKTCLEIRKDLGLDTKEECNASSVQ